MGALISSVSVSPRDLGEGMTLITIAVVDGDKYPFRYMKHATAPCCHKFWNPSPSSFLRSHHNGHPVMTKRKADTDKNIQDPTPNKSKKPKVPKITFESDPTISPDHVKI